MRSVRLPALALLCAAALLAVVAGIAAAHPAADDALRSAPADEAAITAGRELFAVSCSSCHGADGGGTVNGPSLIGVGAAAADFQLTTGRMPFAGPPGSQAKRKPPAFSAQQIAQLVAYVATLGNGPAVPSVRVDDTLLPRGQELFLNNCAPCHGSTANGGAVGGGALAPPLDQATPLQVGEALLTGPGQMPQFQFAGSDVDALATYVEYLRTAPNPGGFSIGGIGPVPEGFVSWVLGLGLLLLIAYLIGREWDRPGAAGPGSDHDAR